MTFSTLYRVSTHYIYSVLLQSHPNTCYKLMAETEINPLCLQGFGRLIQFALLETLIRFNQLCRISFLKPEAFKIHKLGCGDECYPQDL